MIRVFTILLLLYSLSGTAQVISGHVFDSETGKAIGNVSVYFDGMYKGGISDTTGHFRIAIPEGNTPVIVSAVGYYSETIAKYSVHIPLKVYLKPKVYNLPTVTVGYDGMSRQEKEASFIKEFIGTSANASSCHIVNLDDISMVYDASAKTLEAFCDKPIVIKNKALGYQITYYLTKFIKTQSDVYFAGNYFFDEVSVVQPSELRKIKRYREQAYSGSRMHFVRSLWNNSLEREGFKIYNKSLPLSSDSILEQAGLEKNIRIKEKITVIYQDNYLEPSYVNSTKDLIFIDKNGFYDPEAISWAGVMAGQRLGDCLPFEYHPAATTSNVPAKTPTPALKSLISSITAFNNHRAIEKLYLHTDKPGYMSGDTLWFKGYLFNAALTNASLQSGLIYVELANDSNYVVKRMMLPVYRGLTFGQISLEKELPQGGYTLRAYTNRMRNFGLDYVFQKHFYIGNVVDNDWLVNYHTLAKKGELQMGLKISRFDHVPVGLRELQLRISDGKRTLLKRDASTSADGLVSINFNLPEKTDARSLNLTVQDLRKGEGNRSLQLPLLLNRPELTDLQFLPEGGNLVAELPAHIAFKAVGEDGKSVDVSGKIYGSTGSQVASFRSVHKGMGVFDLVPAAGETYSARLTLPDGSYKTYPLPAVQPSGIALHVVNTHSSDSCELVISATRDIAAAGLTYYLTGQARETVCYGASFNFNQGTVRLKVSKTTFPTGVVRFTISGPDKTALAERIIFINHDDNLDIQIADKRLYKLRDSVTLDIQVTDNNGLPVQGSFSLAVTDDNQVKRDSTTDATVKTTMLLTSDLKGTIEDPGYYLQRLNGTERHNHLDHLLLAQGWVGYNWADIFRPLPALKFTAEKDFLIKGRVLNIANKPVTGTGVTLLSKKPLLVRDTITNEEGVFTFTGITPSDTTVFFVQAKNKRDKSFNVGIEMDDFKAPVFTAAYQPMHPWYVNSDSTLLLLVKKQADFKKAQELKLKGGRALKEVVIKAKKVVKDSKNLNGPGEADIIIDQEEIEKAGTKTLGDLLREKVKGFSQKGLGDRMYYTIDGLFAFLIIDGVKWFTPMPADEMTMKPGELFKHYLDYFDAGDIKGIEVIYSGKYLPQYVTTYLGPKTPPYGFAFIEVTTRSGHGPFLKKTPGTYLYKPIPFILPKKHYTPKYTSGTVADGTDVRSTIYWEPNVVTNKAGKASVTFHAADHPGNYSVIIEGTDMKGHLGVKRTAIKIQK